jgi:SulP family sulfate permease
MINRGDFFGGLTAAVVALPLALAFGVASGAGAAAGLYGAIAVGFFAALFGGTPSQVSGPTGPMTVVMAAVITNAIAINPDQGLAIAFTTVSLAGLLQIAAGKLRLGRYLVMVPFPVVSGFMSGIGVIIILLQLAPLVGVGGEANPLRALLTLPNVLSNAQWDAAMLGIGTLVLLFVWPKRFHVLPAPLVALIAFACISLGSPFDAVARIGEIPRGLPDLVLPHLSIDLLPTVIGSAFLLAALGSIDSLLTSLVADNLTRTQHDSDKELVGQGIGNFVAGLIGGLPGAGATMRTLVNVRLGGRSPKSGMLHSIVLAVLMLGAAPLAESIPLAVLAGILLKTGFDIIDWSFLKRVTRIPLFSSTLMLVVFSITVFVDLITAVAIGVFVANLETLYRLSEAHLQTMKIGGSKNEISDLTDQESAVLDALEGRVLIYQLNGFMSYGLSRGIARHFSQFSDHDVLIVDFTSVDHLDLSAGLTLMEMIEDAVRANHLVLLVGVQPRIDREMHAAGIYEQIPETDRFAVRSQAITEAANRLNDKPSAPQDFGSAV